MKSYRVDVDEDGTKWWYLNNKLNRHDGPSVEYACGHKEYWINDQLHRLDGPAVEYVDGTKEYWVNGVLHRLDGPAIEWNTGEKFYYINGVALTEEEFNDATTVKNYKYIGEIINQNGDCIETLDEYDIRRWYKNGKLHNENGPAVIFTCGTKEYYINGVSLTETEFNDTTTVKNNDGKIIEIDGIKYKLTKI